MPGQDNGTDLKAKATRDFHFYWSLHIDRQSAHKVHLFVCQVQSDPFLLEMNGLSSVGFLTNALSFMVISYH
jgi:hypothetical protein